MLRVFSADLPATATKLSVPAEFVQPKTDYKVEVLESFVVRECHANPASSGSSSRLRRMSAESPTVVLTRRAAGRLGRTRRWGRRRAA